MNAVETIAQAIMADPANEHYTQQGIAPLFSAPRTARINIVGQAPGLQAQISGLYWNDKSGQRLRDWLGVDDDTFYHSGLFAVLPMDFYYPGKGKSGDLPPRKGFAQQWHPRLIQTMPNLQLTVLVGRYAQAYYLGSHAYRTLTQTVEHYDEYLPHMFPIVHPSPRNGIWLSQHPWFEHDVVPALQQRVRDILR